MWSAICRSSLRAAVARNDEDPMFCAAESADRDLGALQLDHGAARDRRGRAEMRSGAERAAPEALDHHQECLEILREVGDRNSESDVLNDVGQTYLASGRVAEAVSSHRAALVLAGEVQARREQARAHDGIARCVRDDDPVAAERQALDLYRRIGGPEADRITSGTGHTGPALDDRFQGVRVDGDTDLAQHRLDNTPPRASAFSRELNGAPRNACRTRIVPGPNMIGESADSS